jgi:hypothetical protein
VEDIVELTIDLDCRCGRRSSRSCDDAEGTRILPIITLTVVLLQEEIDTRKGLGDLVIRSRR